MLLLPGEADLRSERTAFLGTVEGLSGEEFETGPTLCAGWAPRDVLAHLLGIEDEPGEYARALGRLSVAHDRIVRKARGRSRAELIARAHRWAGRPALSNRVAAYGLLGDVAVHHQDVLRGLGRRRELPDAVAAAVLREGAVLGVRRLRTHKVVPTDGGRAFGFGREVRGPREALGMWLAGRDSVADELVFA